MSAVDDAKKYLSLRPPMENKTIFALHPDVLVGGLLDEIERLRGALRYILTHCESDSPPNAKALILFVNNALKEGE